MTNGQDIGIILDIHFKGSSVFDLSFETDFEHGETHGIDVDSCFFTFRYDFQHGRLIDWEPKDAEKLLGTKIPYEDQEAEMIGMHQLNKAATNLSEGEMVFYRQGEELEDLSESESDIAESISDQLTPQLYYKIAKAVLDKIR